MIEQGFRSSPQQIRAWRLELDCLFSCASRCLLRIAGSLDRAALRRAFGESVARHEILRTAFRLPAGLQEPLQVILPTGAINLPEVDLSGLAPERRLASAAELLGDLGRPRFDLERGEPWRAALVLLSSAEHGLLLALSAACADAWSFEPLADDLLMAYGRLVEGGEEVPEPPLQYADVAEWLNELLEVEDTAEVVQAWREHWSRHDLDAQLALRLPLEEREPAPGPFAPREIAVPLCAGTAAAFSRLAEIWGIPLPVLAATAWLAMVQRDAGGSLLGWLYTGRQAEELRGVVGPVARYLPVVGRLDLEASFRQAVEQVREAVEEAERRGELFGWDQVTGDRDGCFPLCFAAAERDWELAGAGLRVAPVRLDGGVSDRFSLLLTCRGAREDLRLDLSYDPRRFRREAAGRLAGRLAALLDAITLRPETALADHPAMPDGELRHWLELSVAAAVPARRCGALHELFAEQAELVPDRIAVVSDAGRLTFRELDLRANRLAHHLRSAGAGPEVPVALCLPRSATALEAILAVWKAGSFYVPLDPGQPAERLANLLNDLRPPLLITDSRLAAGLPGGGEIPGARTVLLDWEAAEIAARPARRPPLEARPGNLAYAIYTSGSTGRPKGVLVEHRSVLLLLAALEAALADALPAQPGDSAAPLLASLNAPILFDASVQQIALLLAGHALCVVPEEARADGRALVGFLRRHGVDLLDCTPSQLRILVEAGLLDGPAPPGLVLTAGEAVDDSLWRRLSAAERTVCFNLYGPTECTVDATFHRILPGSTEPTIGRPLPGYQVFLLDRALRPVPPGAPGELCLGGAGLARGYLKRPGLTAERFVPHPLAERPGERLYRSGDLGRHLPEGRLEFLGRLDHQVKIRGFRIEPGEIEAALAALAGVREAAVVAREDTPGDRRLVAYVVGEVHPDLLRRSLQERLPDYMVPAAFVPLPALPLTPSGKVDRKALPAPALRRASAEMVAPRTPVEAILARIWSEILGLDRVGVTDHFFDLGGHSLNAARVMARVRSACAVEMPLRALFEASTIAALAERVEEVRRAGASLSAPPLVPLTPEERQGSLPLSFAQQRLWFIDQLEPGSPLYALPLALRVSGPLDAAVLARSLGEIVRRHEALRTVFATVDGLPVQVIQPAAPFVLPMVDLSRLPAGEATAGVLIEEQAVRPFDLRHGPLLYGLLLRLSAADHFVFLAMHHIVSDGWSMGVLIREITTLYAAYASGQASPLPELPLQYADFAAWQRSWFQGEILETELAYWRRQLAGLPPRLELPTDCPRPAVETHRGASRQVWLPAELHAGVNAFARAEGATPFMVLLAAFQALLSRTSGQRDLAVGSPIAGRSRAEVEGLIGFFGNMLVMRADLSGLPSFRGFLRQVREASLGAHDHQDVPFEKLVEELAPERSLAYAPLFQVVFVLQNAPVETLAIPGLASRAVEAESLAKFELTLGLDERPEGLTGGLEYNTDLYDPATVDRLIVRLARLLEAALAEPERTLLDLPLMTEAERVELQALGRASGGDGRFEPACVHELFALQAQRRPEAPAVEAGERCLTYGELQTRAGRLARHLRTQGVGPERVVGVSLDRSPEHVVALLAVLKAGGAYLPVDPALPAARRELMLADAGAIVFVTRRDLAADLPAGAGGVRVLIEDLVAGRPAGDGEVAPASGVRPQNLAYVIYTSGSTGVPKGVRIEHGAAVLHWASFIERTGLGPGERFLHFAALGFDAAVEQFLAPLLAGATLVLRGEELASPDRLLPALARQAITIANLPTAYWVQLTGEWAAAPAPVSLPLRVMIVAGEAMLPGAVQRWVAATSAMGLDQVRLLNAYGPTETVLESMLTEVPRTGLQGVASVLLGRPMHRRTAHVIDERGELQMVGVAGELCLGGILARDYLGRPDLTAERFVPDPFASEPGARLYRSGDLVRRLPDGDLEFFGRIDRQVKLRGFRIELGEVESALAALPGVREAAVLVRDDAPGDRRLVAYVTGGESASALRSRLRERLPEHMVPSAFVQLDALPMTPNGKLDWRALPPPERRAEEEGDYVAPRTPVEELLAGIWGEVLGLGRVGSQDQFFELGGHSLLATQVMSRLRRALGVEVALRELFEAPVLAELATRVEAAQRAGASLSAPPLVPLAATQRQSPLPLSFAQQRLWFIDQLEPDSPLYNLPVVLRVSGPLDAGVLSRCLGEVVRRHEVLRTVFTLLAGVPAQVVQPAATFSLPLVDLSGLPERERDARAPDLAAQELGRPFDLGDPEGGALLRGILLRLSEAEHVVALTMHHIASDGWSVGILVREVALLYRAFAAGGRSPLPELPVQYADFAVWQRSWLQGETLAGEVAFWRQQLAGLPPLLEIPTDRPRPAVQSFRGAAQPIELPGALLRQAHAFCRSEGVTLYMLLLAVLQALLARHSGQQDLAVGSAVAGRTHRDIEELIGFFVNTLVLRGDLAGEPSLLTLLGRVRETALAAYRHQEVPFERLVQELSPERSLAHTPLFQVMFVLQNVPGESLAVHDLRLEPVAAASTTAKFDLTWSLEERDGGATGTVEYATDLYDAATVERLIRQYERLLAAALATPELAVGEQPLLAPGESQQILFEWNDTAAPGEEILIQEGFEAWAKKTPGAVAAVFQGEEITYGELEERANRLAHHLVCLGLEGGSLVGVHLRRGPDMIVALLAVLKAGAAYVPLEIGHPPGRLQWVLEALEIPAVLTESAQLATVSGLQRDLPALFHVVALDLVDLAGCEASPPPRRTSADALAYIIFTSGSTGTPKGVMVRHRPVANLLRWAHRTFGFSPRDRVLFVTSLSFDLSVFDIFGLLGAGGSVRIATEDEVRNPERLLAVLGEEPITFWDSAPVALEQTVPFLASMKPPAGPALRLVFLSGDWIPVTLPDRIRGHFPGARVVALGGATEATVWSNFFPVGRVEPAWTSIPYGRPIDNARYHVLDARLAPCPVGVPGDLYIGGGCLFDGYAREPELTARKLVPDPWGTTPGSRLYRTGDRARYRADGNLEFLGRLDHQVKIRGFRIELGEIETALAELAGVREAAVVAREDVPGDRKLVAYLAGDPARLSAGELRRALRERLPDYMVPAAFVTLAALPLTANGKVDRKALPLPVPGFPAGEAGALPSRMEETVAAVWCEVLGLPRVGRDDNFFDLGGHSLLLPRVQARLRERVGRQVSLVDLLTHTTVGALARHLEPGEAPALPAIRAGAAPGGERIAIVGLAGRFPGAESVEKLWANLCDGVCSIVRFSDEELAAAGVDPATRRDPRHVSAGGALDGVALFDAEFFGYSPREAEILDPQHRLFLECAWAALEDAGYDSRRVPGPVGVFAGLGLNAYLYQVWSGFDRAAVGELQLLLGNDKDYLPTRVSYKLDLKGPSMAVQTACSSSLVAVHLACQNLLLGDCDMALAGGVSIALPQRAGYLYEEGGIASPDGRCRAFDAEARGTVRGSGAGIVVLKRLSDALADGDTIRAVILGSAVNNDGSAKAGYMAPSVAGQDEVITRALAAAGVDASTIGYVEAHGTGTRLGDPIEMQALTRAFRRGAVRPRSCALGSVKTNLGHLDAAAGVTGLIKATLALQHGVLPPSLGFSQPNPEIDFSAGPFHVQTERAEWERDEEPRRAGVSAFGIGGTNAHAVLEEPPAPEPSAGVRPWHLFVLSARTPTALAAKQTELADHLRRHPEIHPADAVYTLQVGRRTFPSRSMAVVRDGADAAAVLRGEAPDRLLSRTAPDEAPPVVFLFPGQGSQRPGMGAGLYRTEPAFRREIDRSCEILVPPLGFDLRELLLASPGSEQAVQRLASTAVTQPALFAVEHALARLWIDWGIRPQALLGHSLGELVAATLAGVFSLEDALGLVAARGRLVGSLPPGAMLAVSLPATDALQWARAEGLELAAVNGPESCVLSGAAETIAQLAGRLAAEGIEHRRLHTSHAFHSVAVEPILDRFAEEVARCERKAPLLPWISNLTGTWIRPEEATDPGYWTRQMRETVRFAAGAEELLQVAGRVYLEVGPGRSLSSLLHRNARRVGGGADTIASLPRSGEPEEDVQQMGEALGRLWLAGVEVDWAAVQAAEPRRRVPLPTYPFERRRYWIEARSTAPASALQAPVWRQTAVPPPAGVAPGPWLLVGDPNDVGQALLQRLGAAGARTVTVDPDGGGDWTQLFSALAARGELPAAVVYLDGVDAGGAPEVAEEGRTVDRLLELARALAPFAHPASPGLAVVTRQLQAVTGEERLVPERAALLGACAALPREVPGIRCRCIDLPLATGRWPAEALADLLWAELGSGRGEEVVAYRGGRRWVQHLEPLSEAAAAPSRLREGGVYLITGGTGRLGRGLAEHLKRRFQVRLLTAEAAGPDEALRAVVEARERWGRIDGVIHAADLAGARVLAAALADDPPDFVLLCPALAGAAGRVEDAVAAACLAAYAQAGGLSPRTFTLAVDWQRGQEAGEPAVELFERLVSTAITSPQIIVSRGLEREQPPEDLRDRGAGLHARPTLSAAFAEPASGRERWLANVWGRMLGVDRIGAHDNFFDLGGDSLLAIRLMAEVEREVGVRLPVSALLAAPTVERLAARLAAQASAKGGSPLVLLHPGGEGRPLFVLHPVGGDLLAYRDLAQSLGTDRPVYGLQAVAGAGGPGHPSTLEELCAEYLDAVREVQPEGPWLLAGWSFGAVGAYEMARQIESAGGSVRLLAMIDPPPPFPGTGGTTGPDLGMEFDRLVEAARSEGVLPPEVDEAWLRERFDLFRRNAQALAAYVPLPYGGRVTLFRARASLAARAADASQGWSGLARTAVHLLEADHESLLRAPVLERLVCQLRDDLAATEGGDVEQVALGAIPAG